MPAPNVRSDRGALRVDPRLLIGVALVAASTIGVWALVEGLDERVDVYAATETVTPGTRLLEADLEVRSIRADAATAERYIEAGALPDDGVVATRTIGAGELVPTGAVADRASAQTTSIVVATRGPLAAGVVPGARVDVWSSRQVDRGAYDAPAVLVAGAEVAAVGEGDELVSTDGREVELLVSRDRVAELLQALAAGDAIDLVEARQAEDD